MCCYLGRDRRQTAAMNCTCGDYSECPGGDVFNAKLEPNGVCVEGWCECSIEFQGANCKVERQVIIDHCEPHGRRDGRGQCTWAPSPSRSHVSEPASSPIPKAWQRRCILDTCALFSSSLRQLHMQRFETSVAVSFAVSAFLFFSHSFIDPP